MRVRSFAAKSLCVSFGVLSAGLLGGSAAHAQALSLFAPQPMFYSSYAPEPPPLANPAPQAVPNIDDADDSAIQNPRLRRQIVSYQTKAAPGTVIIDTPNTYLYYVLGNGKAVRYGIGVGREGFTWSGTEHVSRKAEWPDWIPPKEMIARQPYLPRFVAGGESNPLGARAIYLGNTMYRIHGTNAPDSIGKRVSSGCIRMLNADVIDLFSRVDVGTTVVVLPARGHEVASR